MKPYHDSVLSAIKLCHSVHVIIIILVTDVAVARHVVKVWLYWPRDDKTNDGLGQQVVCDTSETSLSQLCILIEL